MKIAICQRSAEIAVVGARASVRIGPGAQVDLDQVMGGSADAPCTLEQALGTDLLKAFVLVPAEPAPARASRQARVAEAKE